MHIDMGAPIDSINEMTGDPVIEKTEVWGLLVKDSRRVLLQGYSERTLTSREDVVADFGPIEGTPVLLKQVTTVTFKYHLEA